MATHSLSFRVVSTDAEAARPAEAEVRVHQRDHEPQRWPEGQGGKDYFCERNGVAYAGSHLIVDVWEGERLDDLDYVADTLREMAAAAGASLLHLHLHHFTPNGGVSGVAVLAESHISIHTWPERGFAALDVFLCGGCDPARTLPVIERRFRPARLRVEEYLRGRDDGLV